MGELSHCSNVGFINVVTGAGVSAFITSGVSGATSCGDLTDGGGVNVRRRVDMVKIGTRKNPLKSRKIALTENWA